MRILYLDLDTLRPDHLGCYGYHRNTSPNIDRIAAQGTRFNNYYCTDAPCLPSRAAVMSGRFGIHTGVVGHGGTAAGMRIEGEHRRWQDRLKYYSLQGFLKEQGIYTTYIGGFAGRHSSWTYYAGFREIHDTGLGGEESAEDVTPTVIDWIEQNAENDDWYLHINYWDPHTPYRAPEEFGNPFENQPLPDWPTEEVLAEHRGMAGPHTAQDLSMYSNRVNPEYPRQPGEIKDMADLRSVIDGYDCGIAYMDEHIGRIFTALEKAGVMDDLAIIISSDHGENQGELGIYAEHATADNITCRIPMILRWPGATSGHADYGLHQNIDLLPTLAELLNSDAEPEWDGQSYALSLMDGLECARESIVISQCAHVCQRSLRWGPWLYMRTYHDGFHLFPDEMLFNVEEDPHEENDEAGARPDIVAECARRLDEWHTEMMATMPPGYTDDPLDTVLRKGGPEHARGRLNAYCRRLEESGRGRHIEELKRRHPREFDA